MTKFLQPLSYDNEMMGFHHYRPTASWKETRSTPQLGQAVIGSLPLRSSNAANIAENYLSQNLRKMKRPSPPGSPVKMSLVIPPPTPPKAAPYTNNPYSLEHFTPPPPEAGPYRLGGGSEDLLPDAIETDDHKIQQRLKQIGFGKSTKGYETYVTLVTKHMREIDNEDHPVTPRANQKCSKRSWDGQLKKWRRLLHRWDNVLQSEGESPVFSEFGGSDEEFSPTNNEDDVRRPSLDSCAVSLMDLYSAEPRTRSWGSECSETPRLEDLADFLDGSDSSEGQSSLCRSL